jgi:2'-5' RNA ligase
MGQKLDCYQRFIGRLKPIELRVAGFSYFTHGRQGFTIYAKIELNTEVNQWFAHLGRIFGERHTIIPHITIAKNIPPHAFKMLWPEFSVRQYRAAFTPDVLTVLRRPTINMSNQYWAPFKELHFGK